MLKRASEMLEPGDLVHERSTPPWESWQQGGEKRYGYGFAVNEPTLLAATPEKEAEAAKPSSAKKELLIGSWRSHAATHLFSPLLTRAFPQNFPKASGSSGERR